MDNISDFQSFISRWLDVKGQKNIIVTSSKKMLHEIIIYLYRKYGHEMTTLLNGKKTIIELDSPGWFSSVFTLKSLMCERRNRDDGRLVDMKSSSEIFSANISIQNEKIEWSFLTPNKATDGLSLKKMIDSTPEHEQSLCVLIDPALSLYENFFAYDDVRSAVYRYGRDIKLPSYLIK